MKKLIIIIISLGFISFCNAALAFPGDSSGKGAEAIDKAVLLSMVNNVRKTGCTCGGVYYQKTMPVAWNNKLEKVAQLHSKEMLTQQYFSHMDQKGNDAGTRLAEAGYQWQTYGENIASGSLTEAEVFAGWLHSPGHCRNIMNKDFKEMGVARSGNYWTQVFATGK